MSATTEHLWAAIKTLRDSGAVVLHAEGEGIAALWNIGQLRKVGYYEVIRMASGVSKNAWRAQG